MMVVNYELFKTIKEGVMYSESPEKYINEAGYPEYIDEFFPEMDDYTRCVELIFKLANGTLKTNREMLYDVRTDFCSVYEIPVRTIQNMELEETSPKEYIEDLINYTIFVDLFYNRGGNDGIK